MFLIVSSETSERHTPNDKYENFIAAHLEAVPKCIQTKTRAKCRVPWESVAVKEEWNDMKTVTLIKEMQQMPEHINLKKPRAKMY